MNFRSNPKPSRTSDPGVRQTLAAHRRQTQHLEVMNSNLQRLHNRLGRKIEECKNETVESRALLQRAEKLNERLDALKYKLRLCFQLSGEDEPESLQIVLQQMADVDPEDAPREFICPITQCIMVDPVATADGHVYDRCSIIEWFANFSDGRKPTSPLTNLALDDKTLVPQLQLRGAIQDYLKEVSHDNKSKSGVEEPNVRQVPNELIGSASILSPASFVNQAEVKSSTPVNAGPIWSSSVVPSSEPNSRVLNILRVDDSLPVPLEDFSSHEEKIVPGHQKIGNPPRRAASLAGGQRLLQARRQFHREAAPAAHLYEVPSSLVAQHHQPGGGIPRPKPSRTTASSGDSRRNRQAANKAPDTNPPATATTVTAPHPLVIPEALEPVVTRLPNRQVVAPPTGSRVPRVTVSTRSASAQNNLNRRQSNLR